MRCSSARSSSLGAHSPAATFCSTWSTEVAPAITDPTVGSAASPPMATWSSETPRSAANFSIASRVSKSACSSGALCLASRVPDGAASPRRYLPVSRPRASGKYGSRRLPGVGQRGDQLGLDGAVEPGVLVLRRDEPGEPAGPGDPVGVDHLPADQVGRAEVADLALLHQLVERGQRLLDRGVRVGRVQLVEVDPVGAEPAQAVLHGDPDVAAGAAGAPVRTVGALHVGAELGRDDDLGRGATPEPGRAASPSRRRCRRRRRCRTA